MLFGVPLLRNFYGTTMPLLHQYEVMFDLYESFHAQTSNNIWVVLWWLFIYSCAKFVYLSFVPIDIYKSVS